LQVGAANEPGSDAPRIALSVALACAIVFLGRVIILSVCAGLLRAR